MSSDSDVEIDDFDLGLGSDLSEDEECSLKSPKKRRGRTAGPRRMAPDDPKPIKLKVCAIFSTVLLVLLVPYMIFKVNRLQSEMTIMMMEAAARLVAPGPAADGAGSPCVIEIDPTGHAEGRHETVALLEFDRQAFSDEVAKTKQMLEEYYEDDSGTPAGHTLLQSLAIKPGDEQWQEGLDFMAEKMARALVWGDAFIVGAMGSSVTAGHDNCNYDSYERQLERLMQPVWAAAKVDFVVRNAGEGGSCGDSYKNQKYCIRNMLGDDIDHAHWSWTYFENGEVGTHHEAWLRWALMMPHSPGGLFFNTGGENGDCTQASIKSTQLAEAYGKFGLNGVCLQAGISQHGYPGKVWSAVGDGLHNTTRYGEAEEAERRDSLGVMFRNWHPGPLGFQVVSDAIAYYYLLGLQRALAMIEEVVPSDVDVGHLNDHYTELQERWPKKQALLDLSKLPKPILCDPVICEVLEPPGCVNYELPTYGYPQIKALDLQDSMNPFKDKYDPSAKGWSLWKDTPRQLIPRAELSNPECEHLDLCAGMMAEGGKEAGWISFRLPRFDKGIIIVCSPSGKSGGQDLIDADIIFQFGSLILDKKDFVVEEKCLKIMSKFPDTVDDSKGHLHLGVYVKSTTSVKISHVITI